MDPTKVKLDPYEQELEDNFEKMVPYPKDHPIYDQLKQAAKNYRRDKAISLRINSNTLKKIKAKAKIAGLPYQTLINTLLHQYVSGRIKIKL